MIELITIMLSAVGPAGMGSALKIFAGLIDRWAAGNEAREQREIARDLKEGALNNETLQIINGTSDAGRVNRRVALIIGMSTFAISQILCVLYPTAPLVTFVTPEHIRGLSIGWGLISFPSSHDITVTITTGHCALMGFQMMSLMFGFYFTPGGRK